MDQQLSELVGQRANIFISYRRADTAGHTGRLYDRLKHHFGRQVKIFMDLDSIAPGADFIHTIEAAVGSCKVLVALIGDQWATLKDAQGQPRLHQPGDFVRAEVATALRRGILVIPVLVEGAPMPQEKDLPPELAKLRRLNALEISDGRWEHDTQRLIQTLERELGLQAVTQGGNQLPPPTPGFSWKKIVGIGAAALLLLFAVLLMRGIGKFFSKSPSALSGTGAGVLTPPLSGEPATSSKKTLPAPTTTPALSPGGPQPVSEKINLLDKKLGGNLVIASNGSWEFRIDGDPGASVPFYPKDFGVFGFKDGKAATFATFTLFIPSTSDLNPKEFELLVANDSPEGPYTSLGKFQTKNYRVAQNPFQEFKFQAVKAQYLKVVFLSNHNDKEQSWVHEFQLWGTLN